MAQRHELRWGGMAGVGFLVAGILAALFMGAPPKIGAASTEITAWVGDGRTLMLLAGLLYAVAAGLVIWFTAAFAEAIHERDERSDVYMALLAGSVLIGGAIFVYATMTTVLAYTEATVSIGATVALFQGTMVLNLMLGFAAMLPLAAAGIGVLRTHLMPDWLGYVGLAAAAVAFLSGFGIFFDTGVYAPGGALMPYVTLAAGGIFVACASYFMLREHLPEVAPLAQPQS